MTQAYLDWASEDTKLERRTGNTLAGHLLGSPSLLTPASSPSKDKGGGDEESHVGSMLLPRVTPGDWMRRGMLAERLYHEEQAMVAYR